MVRRKAGRKTNRMMKEMSKPEEKTPVLRAENGLIRKSHLFAFLLLCLWTGGAGCTGAGSPERQREDSPASATSSSDPDRTYDRRFAGERDRLLSLVKSGSYPAAIDLGVRMLEEARDKRDIHKVTGALLQLGITYVHARKPADAERCMVECHDLVEQGYGKRYRPALAEYYKKTPYPSFRAKDAFRARSSMEKHRALETLWHMEEKAVPAIPWMTGLLDDPDPEIARFAAGSLGHLGPLAVSAIPSLLPWLVGENREMGTAASYALSRMGSQAVSAVLKYLDFPDINVRSRVLMVLSETEADIESILVDMLGAPSWRVRQLMIEMLAAPGLFEKHRTERIVALVERLSRADPVRSVRKAARLYSLVHKGTLTREGVEACEGFVDSVRVLLKEGDYQAADKLISRMAEKVPPEMMKDLSCRSFVYGDLGDLYAAVSGHRDRQKELYGMAERWAIDLGEEGKREVRYLRMRRGFSPFQSPRNATRQEVLETITHVVP